MNNAIIKPNDTILVTGGNGFLGGYVIKELTKHGFNSIIYGGREWVPPKHMNLSSIQVDLRYRGDAIALISDYKPKTIIHLAGKVGGIGANQDAPGEFFYDNLQMGLNVVDVARTCGIQRVVILGSVCEYPLHTPVPFAEEHIWFGYPEETNAPYGVAKRALMEMVKCYNKQYGMQNIVLIPTNIYGPYENFNERNSHVIPALIRKFYNAMVNNLDEVVLWGSGNVSREFLYAEDCAEAIVKAMRFCTYDGPINLGTGKEITIVRLANIIADLMNYKGKIVFDTSYPDGQPRRCLKVDKALEHFGWRATTHFTTGLVDTILWYEEQVQNGTINNYI